MSVQETASDITCFLGKVLMYSGGGLLFVMAVVGTVAIDLVILCWAAKKNRDFCTLLLWGAMFGGWHRPIWGPLPWQALLGFSLVSTMIAIILSVCLGVPQIGVILVAGWLLAAAILLLGYALHALGEYISPEPKENRVIYISESEIEYVSDDYGDQGLPAYPVPYMNIF